MQSILRRVNVSEEMMAASWSDVPAGVSRRCREHRRKAAGHSDQEHFGKAFVQTAAFIALFSGQC